MGTVFTNRLDGVICHKCGREIAKGEPIGWNRSGAAQVWHKSCEGRADFAAGGTSAANGATGAAPAVNGNSHSNGNGSGWLVGLAHELAPYIESRIATKLDRDEVADMLKGMLEGAVMLKATKVVVEDKTSGEVKDLGLQHELFPELFEYVKAGVHVWLTGPAGSGKTTAVEKIAEALARKFYHVGAMDNEYKLMGFIDAQGRVVSTVFREWWESGGVICLDEIDSWLPAATLALNGALANGHCTFPDGMKPRHPDCVIVACANTWGLGATNDYVGRMKQDAAFIDRFVQMDWPYDEAFELALAGNPAWAKRVQHLRKNAKAKGLKVIISPRASIQGAKLLAAGIAQDKVERVAVRKGMTNEQWEAIQ
jgi:hypothetical protein